jgi:hypothetical protein
MHILNKIWQVVYCHAVVANMRRDNVRGKSEERVFRSFVAVHFKHLPSKDQRQATLALLE